MTDRRAAAETPQPHAQVLSRLAAETGATMADLGVRPEDERWIYIHAEAIESLFRADARRPPGAGWLRWVYRLARRAARTAR
ncbi:MAG: hypothetical protein M3167_10680 [Acidobacteriota bacterium]|nr:hypothetical protein [Acidobacteriota bacterium]